MTKKIEVFASEALPGELENFPNIKRGRGITKEPTGGIRQSSGEVTNFF